MKPLLDLHNHTIASGHAFSSLQEMVKAAAEKGIRYFGITDHAPACPGAPTPIYFWNYPLIPRQMYGVHLMMGCELNILDTKGTIDLSEKHLQRMDVCLAGIHSTCWTPGTKSENTDGVLAVMHNRHVNVITHPGDGTAELDFEALVNASRQTGTLLEINHASLKPYRHKFAAHGNNVQIMELCKERGIPVIIGADAHISFDIADYKYALPLVEEVEFPKELIVNYNPDLFFEFTGRNKAE